MPAKGAQQPDTLSPFDKLLHGLLDNVVGAQQLGLKTMQPLSDVVSSVYPDASITPRANLVDQFISNREDGWQKKRAAAGDTGPEYMRGVGNGLSAVPLALAMPVIPEMMGSKMLGDFATQSMQGGSMGAMQPIADPNHSYFIQKLNQIRMAAGL